MLSLNINMNAVGSAGAAATSAAGKPAGTQSLTSDQQRRVEELKQIDRKVHDHELAHIAAGAGIVNSGPDYTYTYGPDGKPYATAGEVGIDTAQAEKPQENIDKGRTIQRAALAPQEPSPQDHRVASIGAQLEATGRSDLSRQQEAERAAQVGQSQQKHAAAAAPAGGPTTPPNGATPTGAPTANSNDVDQLVRNAYATVAAGSAAAGRVSVYA